MVEEDTPRVPLDVNDVELRIALIEHEVSQLHQMFNDARPGLAAAEFVADTAGTAVVGVAELRTAIRVEMAENRIAMKQETARANNRTKLAIAVISACSVICGATIGQLMASNMSAARAQAAQVASDITEKRLKLLEVRDRVLCSQCADEAIRRRDEQIDSITAKFRRQ